MRAPGRDGYAVGSGMLTIEDPPSATASSRSTSFQLELADGSMVMIDTRMAELVPWRERTGTYAELEADPLMRVFNQTPGPHVRCVMRGNAILDGDVVEIVGTATAHAFDAGAETDFRTAPPQVVTALTAELIGCGDDPAGALDEKLAARARIAEDEAAGPERAAARARRRSAGRSLWSHAHLVPIGLAFLIAATLPGSSARVAVASTAMSLWLFGAGLLWGFLRSVYPHRAVDEKDEILSTAVYMAVSFGIFFGVAAYPATAFGSLNYTHVITAVMSLSLLAMAFAVVRRTRGIAGTLRAIAVAPPRTSGTPDGTWCSIAGAWDGARVDGVEVASDGAIEHIARTRRDEPDGATWTAVAAGRLTAGEMRATGPASLLVFRCRDAAPRALLTQLVRQRQWTLFALVAAAVVIVAVFIALYGSLPTFDAPDST
ncbi:MAG TPA: hypothetical protein VMZ28_22175 [Kofleriaceae bacterium]|nr:hypothetical protein [Kofleriaceae bacterium]